MMDSTSEAIKPELFWGVEGWIKRPLISETLISVGLIWKETFSALVLVEYPLLFHQSAGL